MLKPVVRCVEPTVARKGMNMATNCPNQEKNKKDCPCTYEPCSRKGVCCECIAYHRKNGDKPACMR
jgi:hypothetical protein